MNIISNAIDTFMKTLGVGLPESIKNGLDFKNANDIYEYIKIHGALNTGLKNVYVAKLQYILRDLGYNCNVTGVYDTQTYRAVSNFQQVNGIPVNGIVDLLTAYYLMKIVGEQTKSANFIDQATRSWIDQKLYKAKGVNIYNTSSASVIAPKSYSIANNKMITIGTMGILMYLIYKMTSTKGS